MKYIIKEATQKDDTLITTVEYDFDGNKVTVDVPHFQPQNKVEIITGIENRGMSEKNKLEKSSSIPSIVNELEVGKEVEIK